MYQDFHATDRWTGQRLHCIYQALIVAIATRHADAVDIKFLASGRPVWIALPHLTCVEYKERTGRVITDPLAIQTAGHFLKTAIESGTYEHGRKMYTLTVDETLEHLNEVLKEVSAPKDARIKPPSRSNAKTRCSRPANLAPTGTGDLFPSCLLCQPLIQPLPWKPFSKAIRCIAIFTPAFSWNTRCAAVKDCWRTMAPWWPIRASTQAAPLRTSSR